MPLGHLAVSHFRKLHNADEILPRQLLVALSDEPFVQRNGFDHADAGVVAEAVGDILLFVDPGVHASFGAVPGVRAVEFVVGRTFEAGEVDDGGYRN